MGNLELINPKSAPKPVGPYSTAVVLNNGFLFLSGQIAIDPKTGEMKGENVKEQAEVIFLNILNILNELGYKKEDIFKCVVYLKKMSDFKDMNSVYESFFEGHKPVRTTVEVSNLPKDALVEIEISAYKG